MKERITYYDSLRGLAIIGVVLIHCLKYQDQYSLNASIILRQLINFSVPLFIALSGFFLAGTKVTNKSEYGIFLKKRIPRVYIPYFVWSLLFIAVGLCSAKEINMGRQLFNLATFQTKAIFYFVALIIQYYILFPVLERFLSKKLLIVSAIISLLCCIFIFMFQYYTHRSLPLIIYAGNAFTWILFFVLGMYLKKYKFKVKKSVLIALAVIAFLLSTAESFFQIRLSGDIGNAVSAVKISSFIYSTLVIVLLLNYKHSSKTIFSDLGKVSYAIYLLHLLALKLLISLFIYLKFDYTTLMSECIICFITLIISYLICITLRKINPIIASKYLGI